MYVKNKKGGNMFIFVLGMFMVNILQAKDSIKISEITPEKPKWGDTVCVTYNPSAESARFLPGDDIYVVYPIWFNNEMKTGWGKMKKEKEIFTYKLKVEEDAALINFYFITLDRPPDMKAELFTMIYRTDGIPARGAYAGKMFYDSENHSELFKKEIELYPDNYGTYTNKWFFEKAFEPEKFKASIKQDIFQLTKIKDKTASLLFSLSRGYMLLGNERKSREIITEMINKFPSYYTIMAIMYYESEVYDQKIQGKGPKEVEKLKIKLIEQNPKADYLRDMLSNYMPIKDISLPPIEIVYKNWIKDKPDNPEPYFYLAWNYSEKKKKLEDAAELIEKAIALLLEGKLRLYRDVYGSSTTRYLSWCYAVSSDIYFQLGNYARALADIKTSGELSKEPIPQNQLQEAAIWQKLGNYTKAKDTFLKALIFGSDEAYDSLKSLYSREHRTTDGFEEWLVKEKAQVKDLAKEKTPAPDFNVVTMEGNKLNFSELKGKIIVINFWSIGCGPCKAEMPLLNKLVDEFGKKEVVFIGFAMDKENQLKNFFKSHTFKFQIVANAMDIAKLFKASALPTHFIINKEGNIEFKITGGGEGTYKQLRALLNHLLI